MKLDKLQIEKIDNQLEKLGIVYVDYKFEILDHIASEVEELMVEKKISFQESLMIILDQWKPKFKKSTDVNFGLIWSLPEILQQKAKKIYWKKMIQLFIATAIFTPMLLLCKDVISRNTTIMLYLISAVFLTQFIGYLLIRFSNHKTTFGFLYKQQFLANVLLYFIPLHSLYSDSRIFERPIDRVFPLFFMIALLTLASVASFTLFKAHFTELNKTNKLV